MAVFAAGDVPGEMPVMASGTLLGSCGAPHQLARGRRDKLFLTAQPSALHRK